MALPKGVAKGLPAEVGPNSSGHFPANKRATVGHFADLLREGSQDLEEDDPSDWPPQHMKPLNSSGSTAPGTSAVAAAPSAGSSAPSAPSKLPRERERVIYFDFDCTLACVHVWKCLAGYPDHGPNSDRAEVPGPHYYYERGQLSRAMQLGKAWSERVMGGPSRVGILRRVLRRIRDEPGFHICVMSKGCVGTIRKILTDLDMLQFFEKTFGANYGEPDEEEQLHLPPAAHAFLAKPDDYLVDHHDAKLQTMLKNMESRGLHIAQAILIDDDLEEVKAVRSQMDAIHVKARSGFGFPECFQLFQMLGLNGFPYMSREDVWDVPKLVINIPLGGKAPPRKSAICGKLAIAAAAKPPGRWGCCAAAEEDELGGVDVGTLLDAREAATDVPTLADFMEVAEEQRLLSAVSHKYCITEVVARGRLGTTFMCREKKGGPLRFLKRVSSIRAADLARLKKQRDAHVLPILDLFLGERHAFVVTGAHATDLRGGLGKIVEGCGEIALPWVQRVFRMVAEGLQFLHETVKAAHGSVRPENILLDRVPESSMDLPTVRIADFAARRRSPMQEITHRYSPFFAPEMEGRKEEGGTMPGDLWAFSMTLHLALMGHCRWPKTAMQRLRAKVQLMAKSPQDKSKHEVLSQLLIPDPAKRPGLDVVLNSMPFFKVNKSSKAPVEFLAPEVCTLHLSRERARALHRPLVSLVEQRARQKCEEIKEAFGSIDGDGDNALTRKEFGVFWNKVQYPEGVPKPHLSEVLCLVDDNCDGSIEFDEWANFYYSLRFASGETLKTSLKYGFESLPGVLETGVLTCQGLQRLFRQESPYAVKALFQEMDLDGTGSVNLQEFSDFILEVSGSTV